MHRDGVGFEYAHDLAKDQCVVADVLHHLITEAKLEMTVGEGDAIIRFVHALQSFCHARLRRYAAKAGVEIAFLEKQELLLRDFGNAGRLVSRAGRLGLDRFLVGLLAPLAQRYMILKRRTRGSEDVGRSSDRCNARYNLTEYEAIFGRTKPK